MDDVALLVGGRRYFGWKSARVTRTMEGLVGSFAFNVSDRWGDQGAPWPIIEGDACRVEINDQVVIDGYVDDRDLDADATMRALAYTGRDRAADLVDCSADLEHWTFRELTIADFASKLAAPFDVRVRVQTGLELAKRSKIVVQPGDRVYEAIAREMRDAGVMLVSDAAGGLLMTRSGTGRTIALVEGENVKRAGVKYFGSDRFGRYKVMTQIAGTDEAHGDATRIQAEATDPAVRAARVLLIRPDKGYNVADARRRADWEARIRAARAEVVQITVLGWTLPSGAVWPLNVLTHVKCPKSIGVDGDMLIAQADHAIAEAGKVTQLRLVRPDAFTPEPKAIVKASGGRWKELDKGGL